MCHWTAACFPWCRQWMKCWATSQPLWSLRDFSTTPIYSTWYAVRTVMMSLLTPCHVLCSGYGCILVCCSVYILLTPVYILLTPVSGQLLPIVSYFIAVAVHRVTMANISVIIGFQVASGKLMIRISECPSW